MKRMELFYKETGKNERYHFKTEEELRLFLARRNFEEVESIFIMNVLSEKEKADKIEQYINLKDLTNETPF